MVCYFPLLLSLAPTRNETKPKMSGTPNDAINNAAVLLHGTGNAGDTIDNVAVFLHDTDDLGAHRLLISQKSFTDRDRIDRWDLPGGGCQGKSPLEPAQCELYEETEVYGQGFSR